MQIRKFKLGDENEIWQLFYDTVHAINSRDYDSKQIEAWAPKTPSWDWQTPLRNNITIVAEIDHTIVGFADMTEDGFLHGLYVHKDYQGQRVATQLYSNLEKQAQLLHLTEISAEASITSKPFFEKQGFILVKSQTKHLRGSFFSNFIMKKNLTKT